MEQDDDLVQMQELLPDELAELLAGEEETIDEEQAKILREFIAAAGGTQEAIEVLEEMLRKAA